MIERERDREGQTGRESQTSRGRERWNETERGGTRTRENLYRPEEETERKGKIERSIERETVI